MKPPCRWLLNALHDNIAKGRRKLKGGPFLTKNYAPVNEELFVG